MMSLLSRKVSNVRMSETDSQGVIYTKENGYYVVGTNQANDNNAASTLNSIIIPSKFNKIVVKIIGKYAFRCSKTLKAIFIPNTIEELRFDCFSRASSLKNVHFEKNSKVKKLETGVFFYTSITEIIMPPSVEEYGFNCFGKTRIKFLIICGIPLTINNYIFGTNDIPNNFLAFPDKIFVNEKFSFSKFGEVQDLIKANVCFQRTFNIIRKTFSVYLSSVILLFCC